MSSCPWPAPAKLNLMLHITGRRQDGYHELQTVFQFIDTADFLHFDITDDGVIRREGNDSVSEAEDIVVRAARLLQAHSGCTQGVEIRIEKHLPMGAGLGGGSSDAATTLQALNHHWRLGYDTEQLADLGLQLGADVPVFVRGFAAFAEGVGERLQAIDLPCPHYLIITPHVTVSTAEIFAQSELTRDCPAIKICDLSHTTWLNVCTPVVRERYPAVDEALEALSAHADARMSGTGASVFASFDDREAAMRTQAELEVLAREKGWRMWVARGMNTSSLHLHLDPLSANTN